MAARIPLPEPLSSGPFTHAEGLERGLGKSRLAGRDLARPFHGVKVPGAMPATVVERCRAFLLRMPPGAFFNSVTAAQIIGVPLPRPLELATDLHVATISPGTAPASRGVVGHKIQLMGADTRSWNGLVISSPERMWCELSGLLKLHELVAVGDYLVHWRTPISSIDALGSAVERYPGNRGKRVARTALPLLHERIESPKESELHVILRQAGFTEFDVNFPIVVDGKRYRSDFAFPADMVVLEYQGDYHRNPAQFRADMTRIAKLEEAGWHVMQLNADDLRDPRELAARIRGVLAKRRGVANPHS